MQKIFTGANRFKILVLFMIFCAFQLKYSKAFSQITESNHKIQTIVIDAGHGGQDSGAKGKHSMEKDIVLSVSLKTGEYIEKYLPDVKVIYTRKTDVFIPLHERSKIANDANADLFISIHANSNPNINAYGSETFAMGLHKTKENLEVAKKENSVIVFEDNYEAKYEGFDPNDIESYIMLSLMQDTYLEQSLNAASMVQSQFRERVNRKDRGVKQAGFLVLWETSMPSILIELGFVSNIEEEKYLLSDQGQDYLASAIFRAFRDYKEYIEGTNNQPEQLAQTNTAKKSPASSKEKPFTPNPVIKEIQKTDTLKNKANEVNTSNDISYKVQIIYSEKQLSLNDVVFKDFNDVEEIAYNNSYKYLVGNKKNYKEAIEYSKWVKSRHPDAFIVAISNGKIIPLSEALEKTSNN